jgi:phosphoglycolate phosphatase
LKVLAPNAVMVGDSTNDVLAARGASVATIVVTQGYGANVANLGADELIGGFGELAGALEKLGF